jgi:hypothetical protein
VRLRLAAKKKRAKFADGYGPGAPAALHAAGRVSANTLEWGAIFLPLLWVCAAGTGGGNGWVAGAGWAYVGARVLYALLAVAGGGISSSGPEGVIMAATLPGYACLNYLAFVAVRGLVWGF